MPFAHIGPIAVHFPERLETNAQLQEEFPDWDVSLIEMKTGIHQRYIASPQETAADLAVAAASKLFDEHYVDPQSIDFVLFCTQSPDYPLPTTACLIQERLGLGSHVGALDFNLGCSGFVYGLSLADGLIQSGQAKNVLLLTGETYTKYIDQQDRSLRTIFGDAAAATLVTAREQKSLNAFRFGTDGSGADTLLVTEGGHRPAAQAHQPRHRKRWASRLYMDGPSLISFTVGAVPKLIDQVATLDGRKQDDYDYLLLHQATAKMLQELQQALQVDSKRLPIRLSHCGNTVSSTLPILISDMRADGSLRRGLRSLLIGFGVGWSWAGCAWEETWE